MAKSTAKECSECIIYIPMLLCITRYDFCHRTNSVVLLWLSQLEFLDGILVLANQKKSGKIHYFDFGFSCLSATNIKVNYGFSFQFSKLI